MLESNHDMTQWEEWNNAPLPISADEAWKEMELLLDDDSSDNVPVPIILPYKEDKGKRKRIIIWWCLMLLGIVLMGGILFNKKNDTIASNNLVVTRNNTSTPLVSHSEKRVSIPANKKEERVSSQNRNESKEIKEISVPIDSKKEIVHAEIKSKPKVDTASVSIDNNRKRKKVISNDEKRKDHLLPSKKVSYTNNLSIDDKQNVIVNKRKLQHNSVHVRFVSDAFTANNRLSPKKVSLNSNLNITKLRKQINEPLQDDKSSNNNLNYQQNKQHINSNKSSNNTEGDATKLANADVINKDSTTIIKANTSTLDTGKVVQSKDTAQDKKRKNKIIISGLGAGLQWNASLPITNNNSNTAKQLIPGCWVSKSVSGKSTVTLSINPFVMHTNSRFEINNKVLSLGSVVTKIKLDTSWFSIDSQTNQLRLDTSQPVNTVATLLQSFGYRIAIDYRYQLAKKWQFSIGLEYNKIMSAYINDKIIRLRDGFVAKDASADYKNGSDLWALMQHNFLSGSAAICYSPINKLTIGFGIHKPFSSIANGTNQAISPSSYFLNIRWTLWKTKD